MSRLNDIEVRLSEIKASIDTAENLTELDNEMNALMEERKTIMANAEQRKAMIETITNIEAEGEKIPMNEVMEVRTYTVDDAEYRTGWLKTLMGAKLNEVEQRVMDSTTNSAGYAVPTQTANMIVKNLVQVAPMLAEVDLMQIPGNITIAVENSIADASLHAENAAVTPATDTLTHISLGGYELMKLQSISAKLDTMAVEAFEAWIVEQLSRKLGELMENYIINGTGSSQPKGIDASATWTDGTNAKDFAADVPTIAELEALIGLQNGAYIANAKFLMNWATFWGIYGLRDANNPAVVTGNKDTGYYIFGFPVVLSAKVDNGDIFFGDFKECVKANLAAPVAIEADRHSGFRNNSVDYRGTCIFDCATVAGRVVKGANTL